MERSDIFLMTAIYGGTDVMKSLDDDNAGLVTGDFQDLDPVTKWIQVNQLRKSGGTLDDASWDAPLTTTAPLEKRGTPVTFAKGTVGFKLGITRVEEKTIDGELWKFGYRADGELVDAHVQS